MEPEKSKSKNINDKLKLVLKIMVVVIIILLAILAVVFVIKQENADYIQDKNQPTDITEIDESEKKEIILDIPSLKNKDAFEILDILIEEYGEPKPEGLIAILKELGKEENIKFETATWTDIKYGYNLTFNFWTDASLGREDSYYITGYKNKNNSIEEVFELFNVPRDSEEFIIEITDLGGAVFHIGMTPKEVADTQPPLEIKEEEELTKEEIMEILETNANKKWSSDVARAKLEYNNQVQAYEWVLKQTQYLDLMDQAKEEWGYDYLMIKWKYEKLVQAHEATL